MIKSIVSVTALAVFTLATPLAAAPRANDQITVNVRDLDLQRPADRVRAERRIEAAIRSLCTTSGLRTLDMRNAEAECREMARASVMPIGF